MFSTLFLKPFLILEIFLQKNNFLTPLTPLFWKNSKFWLFLKILFGGMWHMFSTQFLKPFSILEIFFQKNHFWPPFLKNSKFWLFLKILRGIFSKFSFFDPLKPTFFEKLKILTLKKIFFGDMWHMFSMQFLKSFSIFEIFFQNLHFLTPPFLKKLNILSFFNKFFGGGCGICFI